MTEAPSQSGAFAKVQYIDGERFDVLYIPHKDIHGYQVAVEACRCAACRDASSNATKATRDRLKAALARLAATGG